MQHKNNTLLSEESVQTLSERIQTLKDWMKHHIYGQEHLIDRLLLTVFTGGHILLEWVPWIAKTRSIESLARGLWLSSKRISFTPDLLPSDLIGSEVYRPQKGDFITRKGPIFTNILIADEINRTPPKVQSALLEAMQQRQVTIGDTTHPLPSPFFTLATQNPIEQEGTYPLPEAQLDRFLMKVTISYPNREDELRLMQAGEDFFHQDKHSSPLFHEDEIRQIQTSIQEGVYIDEKVYDYILNIIHATREPSESIARFIEFWASPRASLAFVRLAKTQSILLGRNYVLPDDIKSLAHDVLRHRIGLSYEAIGEWITTDAIITHILENTIVP